MAPNYIVGTIPDNPGSFSTCSKCRGVPKMELVSPTEIHYKCKCFHQETLKLSQFLQKVEEQKNIQHLCSNKNKHLPTIAKEYCIQCNKWLCSSCLSMHNEEFSQHIQVKSEITIKVQCNKHLYKLEQCCVTCEMEICCFCKKEHINHNIIDIDSIVNQDYITSKYEDLLRNRENSYIGESINILIKRLYDEVKRLEKAFSTYQKINKDMLSFVNILYNTYKYTKPISNYNININLAHHTYFNTEDLFSHTKGFEINKSLDSQVNEAVFYLSNKFINEDKSKLKLNYSLVFIMIQ